MLAHSRLQSASATGSLKRVGGLKLGVTPARPSGAAVAGRSAAARRVVAVGAGDIGAMLSGLKKALGQVGGGWVVSTCWRSG